MNYVLDRIRRVVGLKQNLLITSEAREAYKKYSVQIGSGHIARLVSIQALINICKNEKPRSILEMGGGIGTFTNILVNYSNAFIDVYEDNAFCADRLRENLKGSKHRYNLISSYRILPPNKEYDLIIIDGGSGAEGDGGYMDAVFDFVMNIDRIKTIYIEGRRTLQRKAAKRALRKKGYFYLPISYSDEFIDGMRQKGGQKIVCFKLLPFGL